MAKKENDFWDELREQGERRTRRRAKSKLKKLHPATKALAVLFLVTTFHQFQIQLFLRQPVHNVITLST